MPVLLYAANLHIGGGIQVAASVISELSQMQGGHPGLVVWVSTTVDENLKSLEVNTNCFMDYRVVDHRGIHTFFSLDHTLMNNFSCVLVLFGPLYSLKLKTKVIVGFAQAWISDPYSEAYQLTSIFQRAFLKFKFAIQKRFFQLADHMVVELQHVKDDLIRLKMGGSQSIHVISNCASSIYFDPSIWCDIEKWPPENGLTLGFLGRNYFHKNTQILPKIKKILREVYGIKTQILVTFSSAEWSRCDDNFKLEVVNIGVLPISQCPSFYQKLDAVIFPSLLECFSATPLEALVMKTPLFASDRRFVRDICSDFAIYFDPLSPEDAASKIASYFKEGNRVNHLDRGRRHALNFSSPKLRALQYLELIKHVVRKDI